MITLYIEYLEPVNFFGKTYSFDQLYFLDEYELLKYVTGFVAYDWLDNCIKLRDNEKPLFAINDKGVSIWYQSV